MTSECGEKGHPDQQVKWVSTVCRRREIEEENGECVPYTRLVRKDFGIQPSRPEY